MRKKVLFVINEMINGGGQRSLINLLELFDYEKYDVDLLLFKERGDFMEMIPEKVNLVSTETKLQCLFSNDIKKIFNFKMFYINLTQIRGTIASKIRATSGYNKGQIRWNKFYKKVIPEMSKHYDVAISYLEGESLYYIVDKVNADRKISFIHTDYSKINADKTFDSEYFYKVDNIVGISEKCVDILKDIFPEHISKIIYLPNLVSSKSIYRQAKMYYPEEYKKNMKTIILSVGRLTPLKGFDMAIDVAYMLKQSDIPFKWFILGDGELKEELNQSIQNKHLSDCVELIGARKNPYPYIYNSEIIVQTSKYEGKSMVLDEAKILNKPIVVTNYETVKDQINENEGIIVDMNAESIYEGIIKMIRNQNVYKTYLKKHNYSNEEKISEYYAIMGGCINDEINSN